ncbi:MAG: serine/threonine protein kinase [Candidatus Hydrogenedentes bacterium]|nr:serine/threonine protein kinase [Candidatus Hydrogenedentota bacterium]
METEEHFSQGPPPHSRPDLLDSVMEHDLKTQVLTGAFAHADTMIVNAPPVEELSEAWHVGYRLDDRYEVKEIRGGKGASGMGIVFIVEDDHGTRSAVKTLQRRFRTELHLLQRFVREARTWMLVGAHPNIVCAHKLEIIEAAPCLFMEWVPSDTQGNHSVSQRLNHGPLTLTETLDIAYQFCVGMIHATRAVPGLVHRDVKPENLLITPDGTIKITDFGLVRTRGMKEDSLEQWARSGVFEDFSGNITRVGSIFGTPAYMAPEQFAKVNEVDFRADIYALGCCMYECLTGLPPFIVRGDHASGRLQELKRMHLNETATPLREALGPTFPSSVDALVRRCLAKHPRDRWESYEDLSVAILSLMDSLGTQPREIAAPSPSPAEIAAQMRSITLLEGYDQAIHMRKLREGQEQSPYAFHLALASYFHCVEDLQEEEHQLSKAFALRDQASGYEAVRRLTELWVKQGHHARAEVVLDAYLRQSPEALEQVLEPAVRVAVANGRYDDAFATLDRFPDSFRTRLLRAEILRASGTREELRVLLHTMQDSILDDIRRKIEGLAFGDVAGWSRQDDHVTLSMVLDALAPELDTRPLSQVGHAIWPDIGGYPDFAPDMAWLSFTLGELATLDQGLTPVMADSYGRFATFMGYPSRLEKHLERDEYWFWMRETQHGKRSG